MPGRGRGLGIAALAIGVIAISVSRTRLGVLLLRFTAVACAMLVMLGARIDALEFVRADPEFARIAATGRTVTVEVEVRGFLKSSAESSGRTSAWAPAAASTARGQMPVVLWLDESAALDRAAPHARAVPPERWGPGTPVRIDGALVALEHGSSARYGVRVSSFEAVEAPASQSGPPVFRAAVTALAADMRANLRDAAAEVPGAELVPGFAVGDTSLVPEHLDQQMQESSLTHLVAVSGANCALVVAAVTTPAAWINVPRRSRLSLAGVALGSFVVVVGPDPSLQRAAVMAAVVLLSSFGGKRSIALPGLGIAIFALLVIDPWQALQPGFALSVAATAGILLWAPDVMMLLGRVVPSPTWVRLPIAVAVAAQFACGPLLLLVQSGFPAAGLIANVLAAPAAPWGTGVGLLAMLAAQVLPAAAPVLVWFASLPARWIAATAEVTSALPGARWAWPGGWGGALLLAAVEAAAIIAWWLLDRRFGEPGGRGARPRGGRGRREPPAPGSDGCVTREPVLSGRVPWERARPRRREISVWVSALLCGSLGVFLGPTLVVPATTRLTTPNDWNVVACDIGQGDAFLLRDARAPDAVMLVDTGDDPDRLTSCLNRFGVHRIAILVLTHDDRDHVGALSSVVDRVDRALVAPDNREDGKVRPVLAQLRAAGVNTQIGSRGMAGALGDLTWDVLAPEPGATPPDTNSASLVVRVQAGETSVLMLADTGEDEQRALRRTDVDLDADVLKVAHHGSSDHDPELFAAVSAEAALISVGAENSYGHPAPVVTDALVELGTTVLRTDRSGSIAIGGRPGALDVWVERGASSERASSTARHRRVEPPWSER